MSYMPPSIGSVNRTQLYISPMSMLATPVSAPSAGTFGAQHSIYAYPVNVPTATTLDKLTVAVAAQNAFQSLTYQNSLFVGVGDAGAIATSVDGISWTRQTSGVTTILRTVAYGNGKWVVGGDSGTIITSSDAITWAAASSPGFSTTAVNGVAYDGSANWVAVGDGGKVRYATDPTGTWTAASSPGFSTTNVTAVTFAASYWVAVGGSSIRYATDPTGTWSAASSPGFSNTVICVAYGGSTWVAAGLSGALRYATDPTGTWTAASSPGFGTQIIRGLAYGSGTWVGVADNANVRTATDPTGTWTAATSPNISGSGSARSAAYGSSRWVLSAAYGQLRYTSDATGTWTAIHNETCAVGVYSATGALVTSGSITLAGNATSRILYNDVADVALAPGTYYLALWSGDPGFGQFFRASGASCRLRARYVQTGQTSGLPSTLTLAQETTGLVYLFGFTTK